MNRFDFFRPIALQFPPVSTKTRINQATSRNPGGIFLTITRQNIEITAKWLRSRRFDNWESNPGCRQACLRLTHPAV